MPLSLPLSFSRQFCFTGGIIEVVAKLPGEGHVGGLWPAIWLLGNLARATYVGSSNWLWPWSYDRCDRALQPKQLISACAPHPHYGLAAYTGRGAPEIDILEAMPGDAVMVSSKVAGRAARAVAKEERARWNQTETKQK